MLETLREFAAGCLEAGGENEALRRRHAEFFLALAEEAEPGLWGPDQAAWFDRLETEQDNLRAALEWSQTVDATGETGLRLVAALWELWDHRGYWTEGRGWTEKALVRAAGLGRTAARAKALSGAGEMAWHQGDDAAGRSLLEESIAIWRELGTAQRQERGLADALNHLGWVAGVQARYAEQRSLQTESLAIWREIGDRWGIAESLLGLGMLARGDGARAAARALFEESRVLAREAGKRRGAANALSNLAALAYEEDDLGTARSLYEESLALRRELGEQWGIAFSLRDLGCVALALGNLGQAYSLYEESLAINRGLGNKRDIAGSLNSLGDVAQLQGDGEAARALYGESLRLHREALRSRELSLRWEVAWKRGAADCLEGMASVSAHQGRTGQAARLLGAAEGVREALGAVATASHPPIVERTAAAVRSLLGPEAVAAARAEGRAMTLEQAICSGLAESEIPVR
jgi:tetratricopeptide (TPR) repeat protein